MKIEQSVFDSQNDRSVKRYTVTNDHGVRMSVLEFGGIWQEYSVPTARGQVNLLLAADSMVDYRAEWDYCIGQLIGPVANRIGHAEFQIDGQQYHLQANEGDNTNHSGERGWRNHFWHVETRMMADCGQLILSNHYRPEDDDMPGTTDIHVVYTLWQDDQVSIDFYGQSDAATLFNPTSHTYWNLADDPIATIEQQELQINSNEHLAVDDGKIPTGKLRKNSGTPYDFQEGQLLGMALHAMLMTKEKGFDDFFVVEPSTTFARRPIAILRDPVSGRQMKMYSDRNALVVYSANGLPSTAQLNRPCQSWTAIALEAQTLPDAVHHPEFGDIVLRPLTPVHHQIRYEITY